jgi:hypothetical protein
LTTENSTEDAAHPTEDTAHSLFLDLHALERLPGGRLEPSFNELQPSAKRIERGCQVRDGRWVGWVLGHDFCESLVRLAAASGLRLALELAEMVANHVAGSVP